MYGWADAVNPFFPKQTLLHSISILQIIDQPRVRRVFTFELRSLEIQSGQLCTIIMLRERV